MKRLTITINGMPVKVKTMKELLKLIKTINEWNEKVNKMNVEWRKELMEHGYPSSHIRRRK